ncbi:MULTISPECIES: right-handed parallel beta-helix repeat-containing protein [unclassified Nocardiopsis]|uniref:right-handed parallel beta-helix repeat-containing protein n=1 Tax=Nocardiopsis TaxID=2013 RepID=UPI00387A840A
MPASTSPPSPLRSRARRLLPALLAALALPLAGAALPAPAAAAAAVTVTTGPELEQALAAARPGQTITLAGDRRYVGTFTATRAGTAGAPITLTGPRSAVLVNDDTPSGSGCPAPGTHRSGYGLWLYNASHWNLRGFTVADSKKGIVIDRSTSVHISGVEVRRTDEEGVHFRSSSADGSLRDSRIHDIGLVQPGYGEGLYIGSAHGNWGCHGLTGGRDRSDRIQVTGNHFGPNVRGEHIDVKEGTRDGRVANNTFDGRGISGVHYADSWVDLKGNGYIFEDNTGTFSPPGTFTHGYTSTQQLAGEGCGNVFRSNRSDLGGVGGYAIALWSQSSCGSNPNTVHSSNTVANARQGLTNIPLTP